MSRVTHFGKASNGASASGKSRDSSSEIALVVYRPLVEKVVAALGALVTHQIAYLLASLLSVVAGVAVAESSDHGHLSLQWAIVAPAAVAAAAGFILWQLKTLGFRTGLSARSMTMLVVAFFLIQESVEGFVSGRSLAATLSHPAIIIGVVIAPLVAWVMSRALAGVTELAARFVNRPPAIVFPTAGPRLVPVPVRYRSTQLGGRSRPRAPPSRLRI